MSDSLQQNQTPTRLLRGILQARIVEWVVISYDEKDIFYLGY